jgi:iron(III) transport system substrate-binding protein
LNGGTTIEGPCDGFSNFDFRFSILRGTAMNESEKQSKDRNWPKDEFGKSEVFAQYWWLALPVIAFAGAIGLSVLNHFKPSRQVIAYCAQDQVYAESIFQDFEKETGIKVRAVYDSEAVKTVGLANRLLAERNHPQCDVFWGNEEMRTRQMAAQDVFRATNGWAAFGYRSRRIVINTNAVQLASAPRSLLELTNDHWHGKVALAYPQFGTTGTHFHALRQYWGTERWETWCRALAANKPLMVDGNSVVVKLVGKGEASLGLTDSDDIAEGQNNGLPIMPLPMNEETLLIPNTVGIIRNAPHTEPAEKLFDFLQRPQISERLIAAKALEGKSIAAISIPTLRLDWNSLLRDLEPVTAKLNQIFLR